MEKDRLNSLLAEVLGHLQPQKEDEALWKKELPIFAKSLLSAPNLELKNETFSFEKSQVFSKERIQPSQMEKIKELSEKVELKDSEPQLKPFVREVPIRSTQVTNSVPRWAAGAKVEKTIGPLIREDGREFVVDFYRVVKLVGLYQQNNSLPVLLFQAEFLDKKLKALNSPPIEVTQNYDLAVGSIWIRADVFTANAPTGRYIGLKVKDGKIQLSQLPVLQGNKLMLGAQTSVQVSLSISESENPIGPKKKYGKDAVELKVETPTSFAFSFSGSAKAQIAQLGSGSLNLYGKSYQFQKKNAAPTYQLQLSRLLFPLVSNQSSLEVLKQESALVEYQGEAPLNSAYWAISAAELDIQNPLEAAGAGGFLLEGKDGLKISWKGLQAKNLKLVKPLFLADPGRIGLTDLEGTGEGAYQDFSHWDEGIKNEGTSLHLSLGKKTPILYNSLAEGVEMLVATVNASHLVDRPVLVDGLPVGIKTKDSLLILAGSQSKNLLYFIDDNILWDNKLPFDKVPKFKSMALALENALFTLTPVNGDMIFGECDDDWSRIIKSETFLVFGLLAYLPTLPDPYLANLTTLKRMFLRGEKGNANGIISWLVCQISQAPKAEGKDQVKVEFHFGPESNSDNQVESSQTGTFKMSAEISTAKVADSNLNLSSMAAFRNVEAIRVSSGQEKLPDYEGQLAPHLAKFQAEFFSLLDVSSNVNQVGVSLGVPLANNRLQTGIVVEKASNEARVEPNSNQFFGVEGMNVVVQGSAARIFLLPQVAWEPVKNLTPPGNNVLGDPAVGENYYPNDGGPTRLANYHTGRVVLAPKPLVKYTLERYKTNKTPVDAIFTLPFGLKAKAELSHTEARESEKPELNLIKPAFPDDLIGGIQIRAVAKDYGKDGLEGAGPDEPMFKGFTVQLANILSKFGQPTQNSTLGRSVTKIFNSEFFTNPSTPETLKKRGVPLSYIDFSGYGASTFSNWLSPRAAIAETSQARFDVLLGRTGHEVIQVKSILYPWGIRVVRTITLFRTASGYVYRTDSGWQAESDGLFDFRYKYIDKSKPDLGTDEFGNTIYHTVTETPYELHTGVVRGLFNVSNIQEDGSIQEYNSPEAIVYPKNTFHVDEFGEWSENKTGKDIKLDVILAPVWFDADIELDNLVQGHKNGRTPSKKILGYVQLSPQGVTIPKKNFKELLDLQGGLIGGDVDCVMDLNKSGQLMRITRFDVSPSVLKSNNEDDPIFVAAARGNVLLPKDGSWSIVQHETGTGEVTPLPVNVPVPLIKEGKWTPGNVPELSVLTEKLLRLAHPMEILRDPKEDTFNFGFLQSTSTQKALFLTPSFRKGLKKLLSKTPPAFADAYRLMNSNSIFPNIGDGYSSLGSAVALLSGVDSAGNPLNAFKVNSALDGIKPVFELLSTVKEENGTIVDRGFKLLTGEANGLLNKAIAFDVPTLDPPLYLVNMDALKIYIEYRADEAQKSPGNYIDSKLNFDVDSFATDLKDTWKSRMNRVSMVVDLGSFERLMTIKGNFDAQKGKESGYEGGPESTSFLDGLPTPEIEFSDALQPVIDLLQLLASMSTGRYADVLKKGLQIAMSNAGEIWEYKFEATKEIPLVRFPPEDNLYNSPQCPLRLEAGLALGVYFNAALKVTTDPNQLLPTAGAFVQFKGGLEVMCMTVGGATIYAIGSVDLKLACDTKIGPSLMMKFGFGASISVGLPVVGNVSVTYMVGCEIYASSEVIAVTAFMLFKGHASLAGGLVSVTIYIEASGTVKRIGNDRTECTASVTFGLDISICFIIDISFEETWQESRQIA